MVQIHMTLDTVQWKALMNLILTFTFCNGLACMCAHTYMMFTSCNGLARMCVHTYTMFTSCITRSERVCGNSDSKVSRITRARPAQLDQALYYVLHQLWGHRVVQLVEALRYNPKGHGFNFQWCHWKFLLTQSFWPHYGPGVESSSNRHIEMSTSSISWG